MNLHIEIVGFLLISLAIIHSIFPKYFNWQNELSSLSIINRQMMYVHTFFIALTVFFMGLLCITSTEELQNTSFGKKISLGLAIFWIIRFFIQIFGYSSKIWKGKKLETCIHILFIILWSYISTVFILTYLK